MLVFELLIEIKTLSFYMIECASLVLVSRLSVPLLIWSLQDQGCLSCWGFLFLLYSNSLGLVTLFILSYIKMYSHLGIAADTWLCNYNQINWQKVCWKSCCMDGSNCFLNLESIFRFFIC